MFANRMLGTFVQRCKLFKPSCQAFRCEDAAIGIDFGFTNSRVAIVDALVPKVVNSESGAFLPSYIGILDGEHPTVLFSHYGDRLGIQGKYVAVGEVAKDMALTHSSDVIYNFKYLIGRKFEDRYVQNIRSLDRFKIIEEQNEEVRVQANNEIFSTVQLCSLILEKAKDMAKLYQMQSGSKAVIAIPVFFNDEQRKEIKLAGEAAGLDVLGLIEEPIAAALSSKTIEQGMIFVFGMGGGSYSVSILNVSGSTIEVKATYGDTSLSGFDFDNALLQYLVNKIKEEQSVDVSTYSFAMTRLAKEVEKAKVKLSTSSEATIFIRYLCGCAESPVHVNLTITLSKFDELVSHLIGKVRANTENLLKRNQISVEKIEEVILMGAMTRSPPVRQVIFDIFKKCRISEADPEEAVAVGSAMQAAFIVEDGRKLTNEMIPLSLGIELDDNIFLRVIPRHSIIPVKQSRTLSVARGKQYLSIRIRMGEQEIADKNIELGSLEIRCSSWVSQGYFDIALTFDIDKDLVLRVTAKNTENWDKNVMSISISDELSKVDVGKVVKEAILNWRMNKTKSSLLYFRSFGKKTADRLEEILHTLKGVVSEELYNDASKSLVDLQESLFTTDENLLMTKVFSAERFVNRMLHKWDKM